MKKTQLDEEENSSKKSCREIKMFEKMQCCAMHPLIKYFYGGLLKA